MVCVLLWPFYDFTCMVVGSQEFVEMSKWAHLDIAGVMESHAELPFLDKGMSGLISSSSPSPSPLPSLSYHIFPLPLSCHIPPLPLSPPSLSCHIPSPPLPEHYAKYPSILYLSRTTNQNISEIFGELQQRIDPKNY